MNDLEQRVATIEKRNSRVEGDKAWETSLTRRFTISVMTYLIVFAYNWAIGGMRPYLTAFVPVGGYLLSTVTIPLVKRRWIARRNHRKDAR